MQQANHRPAGSQPASSTGNDTDTKDGTQCSRDFERLDHSESEFLQEYLEIGSTPPPVPLLPLWRFLRDLPFPVALLARPAHANQPCPNMAVIQFGYVTLFVAAFPVLLMQ